MVAILLLACISFCLLPIGTRKGPVVVMLLLTVTHVARGSHLAPPIAMAISGLSVNQAVFGLAWFNTVVNLSGVVGPSMIGFLATATRTFVSSFYAAGAALLVSSLLVLLVDDGIHTRDTNQP